MCLDIEETAHDETLSKETNCWRKLVGQAVPDEGNGQTTFPVETPLQTFEVDGRKLVRRDERKG